MTPRVVPFSDPCAPLTCGHVFPFELYLLSRHVFRCRLCDRTDVPIRHGTRMYMRRIPVPKEIR